MNLSITTTVEYGGVVVVAVRGEIEVAGAARITGAVAEAVDRHRPAMLCLDLGLVTYLDPAAVGALLTSHHTAALSGTRLVLREPSPLVRRIVTTAGVEHLLR